MADGLPKSYAFRREREQVWRDLERLVTKAEKQGIRALDVEEIYRLPTLYRATLSSLSVARGISLDRNLLVHLERLSGRAYLSVYGARGNFVDAVAGFLWRDFPAAVRASAWHLLGAGGVLLLGVLAGLFLTLDQPAWFYTFVPESLADGRSPTSTAAELRSALYPGFFRVDDTLYFFASYLFTHNATVGFFCFALGFALGVPTILLLLYNGAIIGAMAALYARHGLSWEFWAWASIHGTTEILAILLCAAAGMMLGAAIVLPGRDSRTDALWRQGRLAGRIVVGAVALFLVAGLLEGFARQMVTDSWGRAFIGSVMLLIWISYFGFAGRRAGDGAA